MQRCSGRQWLAEQYEPVLRRGVEQAGVGTERCGALSQPAEDDGWIEPGGEIMEVLAVLRAVAEQFPDENVVRIDEEHLQLLEGAERVEPRLPAGRQVVRLEVGEA